jgi:hypothetical protein
VLPDGTPPSVVAACHAIFTTGYLMQLEMSSSNALLRYFGGWYEVALGTGARVFTLDLVTHTFWDLDISSGEYRLRPVRILRPSYHGEYLIVRAANLSGTGDRNVLALGEHEVHIAGYPGSGDFTDTHLDLSSFTAPIVAAHVCLRSGHDLQHMVHYLATVEGVLTEKEATQQLVVNDRLYDGISGAVQGYVSLSPSPAS